MSEDSLDRLRFLSEIAGELASSLDMPTLVECILTLLVPRIADWCAVDMLDARQSFQRNVTQRPDLADWGARIAVCWPLEETETSPAATVVRRRTALVYPPVPYDRAEQCSDELAAALDASGVSGALCLPIVCGEQIYGALTLMRRLPAREYTLPEIALGFQIAERLGAAFEHSRLYHLAREAIRLRDDFVSIASHELRTPLTSMLGYVQLLERNLRRKYDLDEHDDRAITTIVDQALRLKRLINSMLDVSRLQGGQLSLDAEPLDLRSLVVQLIGELRPTLGIHRLTLSVPPEPVPIIGDRVRLQQVLLNLLSNAVKYSPYGGPIRVELEQESGWAKISVSDEGIGIPQDSLASLFSRFFRASNANDQRISGIGLGLYVVHGIVALHGGTVTVQSQVGEGATFTVRLPLALPNGAGPMPVE